MEMTKQYDINSTTTPKQLPALPGKVARKGGGGQLRLQVGGGAILFKSVQQEGLRQKVFIQLELTAKGASPSFIRTSHQQIPLPVGEWCRVCISLT